MSFYGKKYRRIGHENIEELLAATKDNEQIAAIIRNRPPTICFTKIDEDSINLYLESETGKILIPFTLGEEKELMRHDGSMIKITFVQESENVLEQTVRMPNGRCAFFRREFSEQDCKLIISMPETNIKGIIYFELIE